MKMTQLEKDLLRETIKVRNALISCATNSMRLLEGPDFIDDGSCDDYVSSEIISYILDALSGHCNKDNDDFDEWEASIYTSLSNAVKACDDTDEKFDELIKVIESTPEFIDKEKS